MNKDLFSKRIYVPVIFIVLVVIICIGKLFYLQVIYGNSYQEEADRQYISVTNRAFDRGTIYFTQRDKSLVSAATLKSGFKVIANGKLINDPKNTAEQIGAQLDVPADTLIPQLSKKNSSYIELHTKLSKDSGAALASMKVPGITVAAHNWRFYPADDLASHAVGFMAFKGDDYTGRYGLERTYNDVLSRSDQRLYVNFFAEVFSDISQLLTNPEEKEGDIITTIEPTVQKNLENILIASQEKWNSDRTGGIIMNPKTGALYAMALDNKFNVNETRTVTDVSQFNNPLVESVFEMGSIMKPVIMAIALDQGAVTPKTTYFDQGFVKVDDRTIYNFDKRGRGQATMQTVLDQSLNTGMVFAMQRMNKSAFKDQWLSFGFGKKTGIDLPAEGTGLVSNINTNRDVEFANISFGQGAAVTPIAMTRALAVLANGGHLVTPHLVSEIEYPSGFKKKIEWPITQQLIKPETQSTITDMMIHVFDSYNEGKLKLEHYSIAAKTGTAQISNPAGGYYTDRNLHTFMAYFPAKNPEFIVFLYNQYPKNGARFSSETLLPPFVDLAKFLINYYNVPPDR